jgi:hypothetical protein
VGKNAVGAGAKEIRLHYPIGCSLAQAGRHHDVTLSHYTYLKISHRSQKAFKYHQSDTQHAGFGDKIGRRAICINNVDLLAFD